METIRNATAIVLLIIGALSVTIVGPAMGMNPGIWIVQGGVLAMVLAGIIADI